MKDLKALKLVGWVLHALHALHGSSALVRNAACDTGVTGTKSSEVGLRDSWRDSVD